MCHDPTLAKDLEGGVPLDTWIGACGENPTAAGAKPCPPDPASTGGMQKSCDCRCCIHEDGMFCRCEWRVQAAALQAEIAILKLALTEEGGYLRKAEAEITRLTADRDAKATRMWQLGHEVESAEASLAALRASMEQVYQEVSSGRALINAGNVSGGLTWLTVALDTFVEHR